MIHFRRRLLYRGHLPRAKKASRLFTFHEGHVESHLSDQEDYKMADLQNQYGVSFPGCMKGLVHFLGVHQHLHFRKMKMLAYRRHGEGKHLPRTKVSKADPDAPSTSQQHVYMKDACFAVEDNINDSKKHSGKSSIRISIPKWRLREQHKKRIVSPPGSRLLRTVSIHHRRSENHVDNVNSGGTASDIEQNADLNTIYASSEQLNMMPNTSDEDILEEKCDKQWSYNISGLSNQTQFDELESHLQIKQHLKHFSNEEEDASSAQKETIGKELKGDIILYPSKEFLAMMNLFNGNIELIQKILEDPSFIFTHYLQGQKATNAQLTKIYSFPATGLLESKDGLFRTKHKRFESESPVKQSGKYISDVSPSHHETTKTEATTGDKARTLKQNIVDKIKTITPSDMVVAPPSILQKMMYKPFISSRFKIIKQRIKAVIKDHKKEPRHISMDGVFHKVPYGKNVMEDMKKRKPGHWEGCDVEKHDREGSSHANWNKCDKTIQKSMKRSQSLNDPLHKYSYLFESISKGEFKRAPERPKWVKEEGYPPACKMPAKTLGRMFSLPDMEYYSSSKDDQSEVALKSSSPKNLTTAHKEESLEREESIEFTTELSSTQTLNDYGKLLPQCNEQDQSESYKVQQNLLTEGLTFEGSSLQELEFMDESYPIVEPKIQSLASSIDSFSLEVDSLGFLNYPIVEGLEHKYPTEQPSLLDRNAVDGFESNDMDLESVQSSAFVDCFSSLNFQVNQKDKVAFNYVREILKRAGLSGTNCLGAWHSPYRAVNPLNFDEAESFPYEINIAEYEPDMQIEHLILFDLINEALLEIYENSFGYFFPWLSSFSTHIRPVPIGSHILEEVWANINWHLKGQPQLEIALDNIVARGFTKNDGWLNLQYDIEDVELEVEDLILDDLLAEVALQLSGFPGSYPN